ncbi:MAG: hypothetical protein E7641_00810 [Ruminococcaceae bacterium]|nr:hypothetical protein [Oscillospiraceae bacterium]
MSRYKKLISNTLILGAGTFASKVIVLLMMPFYTLILSPEEFGIADLVAQTANMLIPIACIGICEGLFRFALDCEDKKKVFTTGISVLCVGSAALIALIWILNVFEDFRGYVPLIAAYVICANFHSACAQYIRAQGRTTLFALQGIINTALTVVLNILFLAVFRIGAYGYVLSVVLGDLTVTILLVFAARLYRDFSLKNFSRVTLSEMLKFSIPYIPTTMLWLIISVSDRYIVRAFCGIDETGLYAASYKIPTLLTLVCGVFIEAWQFSAVKDVDGKERSDFFGKVFGAYLGLIFLGASVLIGGSRIFTDLLMSDSYSESWRFVPILVVATVFSTLVSFMGSVYFVEKKSILSMLTALMGAVINVALNLIMIPDHGAMGAAVATLISYFAVYALRAYDTGRYVKFKLHTPLLTVNLILIALQIGLLFYTGERWLLSQIVMVALIGAVNIKGLLSTAKEFLSFLPFGRKNKEKNI